MLLYIIFKYSLGLLTHLSTYKEPGPIFKSSVSEASVYSQETGAIMGLFIYITKGCAIACAVVCVSLNNQAC